MPPKKKNEEPAEAPMLGRFTSHLKVPPPPPPGSGRCQALVPEGRDPSRGELGGGREGWAERGG